MKGKRCDICQFKDGHENLTMIHCDKCGLAVHRECYGFTLYTRKTFTCWPCQAVGRSFEIEDRDELGNRRRILQQSRPMECALCSVSDGIHAMHPLYDKSGPSGRQISTNNGGLAWAHTLCAFILTTKSFLFGCTRDGRYDATEEESPEFDERSENPELMDETQEGDEFGDSAPVHHFVYVGLNNGKAVSKLMYRALQTRRQLRCAICGVDDKPAGVLRICVQCNANDEDEYAEFRGKHPSLANAESCIAALHVGCARWGGSNPHNLQRVYYFPGNDQKDPVITTYCSLHASDVDHKYQKKQKLLEERRRTDAQQQIAAQNVEQRRKPPPRPRNNPQGSLQKTIYDDLIANVGKIQDKARRQEAFTERKEYWKRCLNSFTQEQFSRTWKIAKNRLAEYIQNGSGVSNQNKSSQAGSMRRMVSQANAEQRRIDGVMVAQRQISQVIANQTQRPQIADGSAKRKHPQHDTRTKPAGKRRGTKPTKAGKLSDDEFEWEQSDHEGDPQNESTEESKHDISEPFSLVSGLCHPLPTSCTCFKTELLASRHFRQPPPRTNTIGSSTRWDLV